MPAWYVAAHIDITDTPPADNKGCAGKVGYPNRDIAVMARARFGQRTGQRFDVYCCPRCGQFHIGRNPKKRPVHNAAGVR